MIKIERWDQSTFFFIPVYVFSPLVWVGLPQNACVDYIFFQIQKKWFSFGANKEKFMFRIQFI
jgi:hypothetical protein